jgi:hypothetical protein
MTKLGKQNLQDKKKILVEERHVTRPARLEGVVKEAKMRPIKKIKKKS